MSPILTQPARVRHPELPDTAVRSTAKADLRKPDMWKLEVGRAIARVASQQGLSLKEFAAGIDRDPRQVARWMEGAERPQFDAILAVERFRQPLVIAIAELVRDGIEIVTEIRVKRSACL